MAKSISKLVSTEFVGRLAGRAFEYGITIIIARALGADSLGTFAFALIVLRLSSSIARAGLDTALLKFIPIDRENGEVLTGTVLTGLIISSVIGVVFVGVFQIIPLLIPGAERLSLSTPVGLLLLGIPLLTIVQISEAATRGFNETKYAVYIREFGMRGVGFVLVIVAILLYDEIRAVIGGYVVALAIAAVLGIFFLFRLGAFRGIRSPTFDLRRILVYSLPVAGVAITSPLVIWSDILMLGFLGQSSSVGIYQAAHQTAALLAFALISVNAVFPPLASSLYEKGQMQRLDQVYSIITMWITALTAFAAIFAAIFASEILLIFGEEFVAAQLVLIILIASRVIDAGVGPAGYLLSMTGHERLELLNTAAVAILNIGLNYVLIQQYGIFGAAVATSTSLSLLNLVRLFEVRYLIGILPYTSRYFTLIGPLVSAVVVMILGQTLPLPSILSMVVTGALSFGVFLMLCWRLVISKNDRILVESVGSY